MEWSQTYFSSPTTCTILLEITARVQAYNLKHVKLYFDIAKAYYAYTKNALLFPFEMLITQLLG